MEDNKSFHIKKRQNHKADRELTTKWKEKESINRAENKNLTPKIKNYKEEEEAKKLKKMEQKIKVKKIKQLMKKRLIIRNLSFKVSEENLKEIFSKFGKVLDVNIPLKKDGRKRGFAFVRYKEGKSLIKAVKEMNFKNIEGRPIAVDYAVPKTKYHALHHNDSSLLKEGVTSQERKRNVESPDAEDSKVESESDSNDESAKDKIDDSDENADSHDSDDDEDEGEKRAKTFFKEFDKGKDMDNYENEDSHDDSSDEDVDDDEQESDHSDDNASNASFQKPKKKYSDDLSEKKTVFIRNISYTTDEDDLREVMTEFGDVYYCLLCVDHVTDHPKGTAFVKFKEKESAEKLIEESSKEPGILLDGRELLCTYAVSREELSKSDDSNKVKDKRNLRLFKCGLIVQGSQEAKGVSEADMKKRYQLEVAKRKKLQNVNFFISDKRLIIHNLPKNITDKDLHQMFQRVCGKRVPIKKALVMKDFKKTDAQGIPVSKGFGFVSFSEHEHALKALMELNNNPNIFTPQKRPIVEFSVENKVALLSQEKKREKMKLLSKKRKEQNQQVKEQNEVESKKLASTQSSSKKFKKRKNQKKILPFKKAQQRDEFSSEDSKNKKIC